ncbi:MAG: hypothetical protein ACR2M4_14225 [Actinomycetota bacterium]
MRHRHDRLDDGDIVGIVRDVAYEGLVDLDAVEREALEILKLEAPLGILGILGVVFAWARRTGRPVNSTDPPLGLQAIR